MNIAKLTFGLLASALTIVSCGPSEKNIVISNAKPLKMHKTTTITIGGEGIQKNKDYAEVYWDIKMKMNGTDFGIIEGGKQTEVTKMTGKLTINSFDIVKNEKGQAFYYYGKDSSKVYFYWDDSKVMNWKDFKNAERDLVTLKSGIQKINLDGGSLNPHYTFDISYGRHGNKAAKLEAAKKAEAEKQRQAEQDAQREADRKNKKLKADSLKAAGGNNAAPANTNNNTSSKKKDKKKKKKKKKK